MSNSSKEIDPIRDLLGKLEDQVGRAEGGRSADRQSQMQDTLGGFQSRLAAEVHEIRTLREDLRAAEKRGSEQLLKFTQAMTDLRSQLPELIDETVSSRMVEIEERFHQDIKEIHNRSVDAFVQSAQARVGQRISGLESSMASQIEAMAQLQDYHLRTDRNVQRLLGGLDRLSAELMRLSNLAGAPIVAPRRSERTTASSSEIFQQRPVTQDIPNAIRRAPVSTAAAEPEPADEPSEARRYRKPGVRGPWKLILILFALVPIGILAWKLLSGPGGLHSLRLRQPAASEAAEVTGAALQLKNAAAFASNKDYAAAENLYRAVIKGEPGNTGAIKELASVLFKQQRYEEAAAVLKTLPAPK
jgi:hypothetical protein